MLSVDSDLWPPADYTAALIDDPRGCCWPWGPCGPRERLQLRVDIIGFSNVGAVDPSLGRIATGQSLMLNVATADFDTADWLGDPIETIQADLYADDQGVPEGPWLLSFQEVNNAEGWGVFCDPVTWPCPLPYQTFDLPITNLFWPSGNPPTYIHGIFRRWYEPMSFPTWFV